MTPGTTPEDDPATVIVERDDMGRWWHPDIDWYAIPEDGDHAPRDWSAMGWDSLYVTQEQEDPEGHRRRMQDGTASIKHWHPQLPKDRGDGWFLAAIYDTEDGAAALWLRKTQQPGQHQAIAPHKT